MEYLMNPDHIRSIDLSTAIITVSSTRTRETDTSGQTITDLCTAEGIPVTHYAIVPDDITAIRRELFHAIPNASCIIFHGGTGLTPDDCTIEAVEPLLDKIIDGFGELFRWKSYEEIGTAAILSRALAGTVQGRVVFCIPGSRGAVTLAVKTLIIPELRHLLSHSLH